MRLREENLLRDVDLHFDKAYKEEEHRLLTDLERRHSEEQIAMKRKELEEQMQLKREMGLAGDKEEEQERVAVKQWEEGKKREQERRVRMLGLQKQEMVRELDKEMENKYADYEDMLRRKREEDGAMQE